MKCKFDVHARPLVEICSDANEQSLLLSESEVDTFPRAPFFVVEYRDGVMRQMLRNAICERELTLFANEVKLVTLLCSGVALRELAYGFLYNEGVINRLSDVRSCSIDNRAMTAAFDLAVPVRKPDCPTVSSGFGGKALYPPSDFFDSLSDAISGSASSIAEVMKAVGIMNSFAREYTVTRGIHCSALFMNGVPVASFEDIGRHNTFDKLAGRCLLDGQSTQGALLTTTGRISGEMMRKALRLGVSCVASLSGPTDQAVHAARRAGILLAGYVKETSATVYAGLD